MLETKKIKKVEVNKINTQLKKLEKGQKNKIQRK